MGDGPERETPVEPNEGGEPSPGVPGLPAVGARSDGACRVHGRAFVWEHTWETERVGRLTVAAEGSTLRVRVAVWRHECASMRTIPGTPERFAPVPVYSCRFESVNVVEPGEGLFPERVSAGDGLTPRPRVATVDGADVTPDAVERLLQWCASRGSWGRRWRTET